MNYVIDVSKQFIFKTNELEMFHFMMEGRLIGDIANQLDISNQTVITRQREIMQKLECSTMWGVVVVGFNLGYLKPFKEIHNRVISNHRSNVYLNETERQILQLMTYDLKVEEIALILKKKDRRVKEIHMGILQKFGVRNDMQLLAIAMKNNLIAIPVEKDSIRIETSRIL